MKKIQIPESFQRIKLSELIHFDILNHCYGTKLTAWHGQTGQKPEYGNTTIAPYHTNGIYDFGAQYDMTILMDTELRNTGSLLENEYMTKKDIRIDVIRRTDLTDHDCLKLAGLIEEELGKESLYGAFRFVSFAERLRYVGWMFKWIPVSDKQVVCSGRWAKVFQKIQKPISPYNYNKTIPNDITLYALQGPEKEVFEIYTLKLPGEYYDPKSVTLRTD